MPDIMDSRSGAPPRIGAPVFARYTGVWRFEVAPRDSSVPRIRRTVRDLLRRQRAPVSDDLLYGALLILSELVTNGVRHAALLTSEIGVEVTLADGWMRLAVEDGHPYRPEALCAAPDHTSGRGLHLVKHVTAEAGGGCGVEPTAVGGKVIWAEMPLDRG